MGLLKQNSKMKKDSIYSFGITPVKTCPMAGACKKFCYAQKGYYIQFAKTVKPRLERDLQATKQDNFVELMSGEISRKRKIHYVRIHTEGDFYDQEYLDKWVQIAKQNPKVSFYCYTKSLHLDWSGFNALGNTKMIQSEGGLLDSDINYKQPNAKIFNTEAELNRAEYTDCSASDLMAINPKTIKVGLIKH